MFELMITLLLASSCPSPKTVNSHSQSSIHLIAVVDTSGDQSHFPPGPFGRKYLPIPRTLVAMVDTSGDQSHFPPGPFGLKYLPMPRTLVTMVDTSGDQSHFPPRPFGRKHIIKA
jgi:hypothetical protein